MTNYIKCQDCKFWSGQIGASNEWSVKYIAPTAIIIESKVVLCAVRINPQPCLFALNEANDRLCSALHQCPDFEALK